MKKRMASLLLALAMMITLLTPISVSAETAVPTYTVLVLDTSGTHNFYYNSNLIYTADAALPAVKETASSFAKGIVTLENNYVAVISCKDEATLLSDFSQDGSSIVESINALTTDNDEDVNLTAGLQLADELLTGITEENAVKNVVIFSTGYCNKGESTSSGNYNSSTPGSNWYNMSTRIYLYKYANAAVNQASAMREYANIYSVGLFAEWDDMPSQGTELVEFFKMFVADLASEEDNFYSVSDEESLNKAFEMIGNQIVENPYDDVTYKGYYFEAVLWADEEEITTGKDINTFDPSAICTREQMVTFLWRKMGKPEPVSTNSVFTDLDPESYSYKAILWASEEGITKGTSETTFSPKMTVTREQVVTFLWRIDGATEMDAECVFSDVSSTGYAYNAILWAQEEGITKGITETTFCPKDPCTRGQIITFMYRYYVE